MDRTMIIGLGGTGLMTLQTLLSNSQLQEVEIPCTNLIDNETGHCVSDPLVPELYSVPFYLMRRMGKRIDPPPIVVDISICMGSETVANILRHPNRLYRMTPQIFELFVAELYRGLGYSVTHTQSTRDGGVDLYMTKNIDGMPHRYIVQCKHRKREKARIGVKYARELLGVATDLAVTAAILVTNIFFSADTRKFANRNLSSLFCVDQLGLADLMHRYLEAAR
jgi:HJR/Mrr/RecB family endonuclease